MDICLGSAKMDFEIGILKTYGAEMHKPQAPDCQDDQIFILWYLILWYPIFSS
jgi:hypothetical protein